MSNKHNFIKISILLYVFGLLIVPYIDILENLSLGNIIVLLGAVAYLLKIGFMKNPTVRNNIFWICTVLLVLYIIVSITDANYTKSIKPFLFPIAMILSIGFYLQKPVQFDWFIKVMIFFLTISSFVAVLQAMDFQFAWDLRLKIGVPEDKIVLAQIGQHIKPAGLAYVSVQLTYQIITIYPFVFYIKNKNRLLKRSNHFANVSAIIIAISAIAVNSIAAIVAVAFSYLFLSGFKRPKLNYIISGLVIILLAISLTFAGKLERLWHPDTSALSRIPMTLIGLNIIKEHPFGVKIEEANRLKAEWTTDSEIAKMRGANYIIGTSFHNSFIAVAVKRGIFFLFIYLFLYTYLLLKLVKMYTRTDVMDVNKYFYKSIIFSIIFYIFNSSIHNAGLPTGDIYGWTLIGLAMHRQFGQNNPKSRLVPIRGRQSLLYGS